MLDKQLISDKQFCIFVLADNAFSYFEHPLVAYLFWYMIWDLLTFLQFLFYLYLIAIGLLFRQPCWWNFTGKASEIPRRWSLNSGMFVL